MILYVSVFWLSVIISVSLFPDYKRALEFEKQGDDSLLVGLVISLGKQQFPVYERVFINFPHFLSLKNITLQFQCK